MESRVNYLVVGAFVVVLTTILAIILVWLSTTQRKVHHPYIVYMGEAASGLSEQAPVKFMGVDVGYVESIDLNPRNRQEVRLLLQIQEGTPIDQSTTATLMAQGVTGVTYVGLKASEAAAPPLTIQPGELYPVIPWRPSVLVQLDTTMREVTSSMKKIGDGIENLLNPDNQRAIRETLTHLDQVTGNLAKNSQAISATISNISEAFNTGENVLDNFQRQAMPQMTQILHKMDKTLQDTQQLVQSLKNNPSALIRGQAAGPKGPGE